MQGRVSERVKEEMVSADSLQAGSAPGGGSAPEASAHDVHRVSRLWPVVLLKPTQRLKVAK